MLSSWCEEHTSGVDASQVVQHLSSLCVTPLAICMQGVHIAWDKIPTERHCVIANVGPAQSSRAIISSFDIGVKLSRSIPCDARRCLEWAGTNFWFRCGAIDNSVITLALRSFRCQETYHVVRNRTVQAVLSKSRPHDANRAGVCLDPSVRRRTADTSHQWPRVFAWACIPGVLISTQSRPAMLF